VDVDDNPDDALAFIEGLALSNYQFLEYFKDKKKKKNSIKTVEILSGKINKKDVSGLEIIIDAVTNTKDLVNQPLSFLTAEQLAEEAKNLGNKAGFSVTVFDKEKIEKLGMGGLLAVNKGSIDPPTFSILEWKPDHKKNSKPIILVGKGIVYDTGGLSLKPTQNSMDLMKCDMAGAAAVLGAVYAIAKSNLPVHIIGLLPATDNRPDGNAYVPGDVIKMFNGLNVEVLNTDAEGRMILADALSYAKDYDPELVIDIATLTGSAEIAIGKFGIVAMGTAERKIFDNLDNAGKEVCERIVEFPFWKEYAELLKSDVADIKNVGGRNAGAITAGKFLERFTDYPWIHLDIAGTAFLTSADSYRGKGATGSGVRLLFEFIKSYEV
ncbi:M17 family metallopeptidase, partial [Bacteroidota bacterium]